MPFNGQQIIAPVSFGNVQRALSTGLYSESSLCRHPNVNMFAKYKPIRYDKRGILTNAERSQNVSIWTGYVCTWGIKRKVSYDYTQFEVNGVIASDPWVWDKPTGNAYMYRITDFACYDNTNFGYNIKAVPPIAFHFPVDSNLYIPISGDSAQMSFIFTFNNGVLNWSSTHSLALADILTTAEMQYYPTLIMVCRAGNRVWRYGKSGDNTMYSILHGSYPYAQILVDTQDIVDVVNEQGGTTSSACFINDTVWTCCMILSSVKLLGTRSSYQINSGAIARLEYQANVDTFDMSVVRTEWTDQISGFTVSLVLTKRSGYSPSRYYIDSITIDLSRTGSLADPRSFYVEVLYTCIGGYMSTGGQQTTVTDGITIQSGQASIHQTYPTQFDGPEFVFAGQSGIPQGVSVAGIGVSLLRTADRSTYLSANFNIDCSSDQGSYSASKVVK